MDWTPLGLRWAAAQQPINSVGEFLRGPPPALQPQHGAADAPTLTPNESSMPALYASKLAGVKDPRLLTEEKLLAAGVAKVFHRRKLMRWTRELKALPAGPPATCEPEPEPEPE
eukprot:SAG22_NODE_5311_length_1037_cov_465.019149_2_plen_113_part_01